MRYTFVGTLACTLTIALIECTNAHTPFKRLSKKQALSEEEGSFSFWTRRGIMDVENVLNVKKLERLAVCETKKQPSVYGLKGLEILNGQLHVLCGQSDKIAVFDLQTYEHTGDISLPTKTGSAMARCQLTQRLFVLQSNVDYTPTGEILVVDVESGETTVWSPDLRDNAEEAVLSIAVGDDGAIMLRGETGMYLYGKDLHRKRMNTPNLDMASLQKALAKPSSDSVLYIQYDADVYQGDTRGVYDVPGRVKYPFLIIFEQDYDYPVHTGMYTSISKKLDLTVASDVELLEHKIWLITDSVEDKVEVAYINGWSSESGTLLDYSHGRFQPGLVGYQDGTLVVGDIGGGGYCDVFQVSYTEL